MSTARAIISITGWISNPANDVDGAFTFRKGRQANGEDRFLETELGFIPDPSLVDKDGEKGVGAEYYVFDSVTEEDVVNPNLKPPFDNKGKNGRIWLNKNVVNAQVGDPMNLIGESVSVPYDGPQSFKESCLRQTERFPTYLLVFTQFTCSMNDDAIEFKMKIASEVQAKLRIDAIMAQREARKAGRRRIANEIAMGRRQPLTNAPVQPTPPNEPQPTPNPNELIDNQLPQG